jgi:hypothetical protein
MHSYGRALHIVCSDGNNFILENVIGNFFQHLAQQVEGRDIVKCLVLL